jgi:S1-C subfamily serine protease
VAFVVAAFLLANSVLGAWFLSKVGSPSGARPTSTVSGQVEGDKSASAIAQIVDPAVVDINTFAHVFGEPAGRIAPLGAGTGMILTSTGQILTNNHVVERAVKIEVTIAGRPGTFTATVVGVDPTQDVALLQLQGVSGLPTITPADAATVSVGDRVLGIGNALGRGGTPSVVAGSISGMDRTIRAGNPGGSSEQLTGMLETNAQIQPGDSGGPLVDTTGHVVGMITAGGTAGGSSAPVTGFAIPVDTALGIVDQIRAGGSSSTILLGDRGHMGIAVRTLDPQTGRILHVSSGALVVGVEPGSPAADAGITAPAVIRSIGGRVVISGDALGPILHAYVPGDHVVITWVDATGTHTKTVLLDTGPAV